MSSVFGALIVDLSDAVLPGREVTLELNSLCGKLIVTVPADARVVDEGSAIFSKRSVTGGSADGDGPLIRVTGNARFGKIVVYRGTRR
nr:LiaF domain-containing protein [Microbispora sp. CL1-1]